MTPLRTAIYILGALLLTAILYATRPFYHGLIYGLTRAEPSVGLAILLAILLAALTYLYYTQKYRSAKKKLDDAEVLEKFDGALRRRVRETKEERRFYTVVTFMLTFFILLLTLGIVGSFLGVVATADHVETIYTDTDTLPETSTQHIRILPKSVANEYASNSLQYPKFRADYGDVTFLNGTPHWSYVMAPDGGINLFRLKGRGALYVNMSRSNKDVKITESTLPLAPGQLFTDHYKWRLHKDRYWVTWGDPYPVNHDGEVYIAVPEVQHDVRLLPIPHSVPRWTGTALIHPDGDVEYLDRDAAQQHAALQGQKLYPYWVAKSYVKSMAYRHGIINAWFLHEDQLEVAPVPGDDNDQPFTVLTTDGVKYFVAAEPWGDAQGVYQIWVFDARSGTVEQFQLPLRDALLGPEKASQYVRKANPLVDWDRMSPSEPVPVVRSGDLWWHTKIVPNDSSGIAYNAFVDARSGDVETYQEDRAAAAFLRGVEYVPDRGREEERGEDYGAVEVEMWLVIERNGSVVGSVPVAPGDVFRLTQNNTYK